jgi:hypothetical protein
MQILSLSGMAPGTSGPPPMGSGAPPPETASEGSEIQDFLDQVADGSVTDEDLDQMKTFFASLQNQGSESKSSDSNSSDLDAAENKQDPFQSFLDKVAAGTVTDSDRSFLCYING